MPLELHPVEPEDFLEIARIQTAAFSGGGMTSLMTPSPLPPDHFTRSAAKHLKSAQTEPDVHYLKVIDTDLGGQIVAVAKWRINERERSEEEIQGMLPFPGEEEQRAGREGARDFMNYLVRVRREYMGTRPFYFLHMLVTDPMHHRRGAGAILIRWGTEKADLAGLPSFLESSRMGRPLYSRHGFTPRHEEVFELERYGLTGTDSNTVMIRDPIVSHH